MKRFVGVAVAIAIACSPGVNAEKSPAKASAPPASTKLWTESAAPPAAGLKFDPTQSLAPLVKKLKPTVVNINATTAPRRRVLRQHPRGPMGGDPFEEFFRFFGQGQPEIVERPRQSLGTGFVLTSDGIVVTNNHVIQGADELKVTFEDGRDFRGHPIGSDPKTDVAIVQLEGAKNLPAVVLGDSDALEVGDWVIAIGQPFRLGHTVTSGIVSAKERTIGAGPYDDFIQTDAAINPGNSGGPLFNLRGEVIGINTAIANPTGSPIGTNIGIGFAIPINMAKSIVGQIRERGHVVRGWLGVHFQEITDDLAKMLGLPKAEGALVAQIVPDSPAAKAGLRDGDVIVEFNGRHVLHQNDLPKAVVSAGPGARVKLVALRDGKRQELVVTIGENPEDKRQRVEPSKKGNEGQTTTGYAALGIGVGDAKNGAGVIVLAIDADGPAAGQLQEGDVIRAVNRRPVRNAAEYRKIVASTKSGERVLLQVGRGDDQFFVVIPIP